MKNAAGFEIFNGFGIKYPEYETITPQGMKSYTIRTMTVSDEEKLKASMVTPSKLPRLLAEVLWGCVISKPADINTFDDFITKTTLKDRDALLYGLYNVTYKNVEHYDVTCGACEHINSVNIDIVRGFRAVSWDKATSVLETKIEVPLKVFDGVVCYIRQPTMADEIITSESNAFASEQVQNLQTQLLMISHFKIIKADGHDDSVEERDNILTAYNQLPAADKTLIDKAYIDNFDKYKVRVLSNVRCEKCGGQKEVEIDLTRQFFRALYR